jgi:PhnB protein
MTDDFLSPDDHTPASGDDGGEHAAGASSLTPMLTVADALAAMDFYRDAFGAVEQSRFTSPDGHVVAELAIDGLGFFVVDENPEAFNVSPTSVDATTVRMNLIVDDPDATAARAIGAGATLVFPVTDQPYGLRQGRVADPEGHHWLIGAPLGV